jgi:hypothetical protein
MPLDLCLETIDIVYFNVDLFMKIVLKHKYKSASLYVYYKSKITLIHLVWREFF